MVGITDESPQTHAKPGRLASRRMNQCRRKRQENNNKPTICPAVVFTTPYYVVRITESSQTHVKPPMMALSERETNLFLKVDCGLSELKIDDETYRYGGIEFCITVRNLIQCCAVLTTWELFSNSCLAASNCKQLLSRKQLQALKETNALRKNHVTIDDSIVESLQTNIDDSNFDSESEFDFDFDSDSESDNESNFSKVVLPVKYVTDEATMFLNNMCVAVASIGFKEEECEPFIQPKHCFRCYSTNN